MKEMKVILEPRKFSTKYNLICYVELNLKVDVDKLKSVKRGWALSFTFGNSTPNLTLRRAMENIWKIYLKS